MNDLHSLCINTIRMLSADCIQRADSGHPGMPMGAAPMAYVLWTRFLRHNPRNPDWPDRDRFILSAGHGSMLIYSLLHLTGYDLTLEELKNFRQWGSRTPGHPEFRRTPGVETTTGPLGQGLANAVGMAIAERYLAAYFNRPGYSIVDHFTYVIASDGDLMEGISHEAASIAGHLKLGRLICLYDDNRITIDGTTDISFTEDRLQRFEAYGWHVQEVRDGNDLRALEKALVSAREVEDRPSLIAVRTHIGFGSPNKQDSSSAHGEPLGAEELLLTKKNLGWPLEPECYTPEEAVEHLGKAVEKGEELERAWAERFRAYKDNYPEPARQWEEWMGKSLPEGWESEIPHFPADPKGMATRVASGAVLNALASRFPNLIGGSADLSPSNKTEIKGHPSFQAGSYNGRNLRFGVREHGMGGILNGMALHGGLIPYGGTFLIFSDYMRPPIRLAAMMSLKVIYIFTHDSIGLGEDGPTHQPVEQIASLRCIPGLTVIRPCDANETAQAWRVALQKQGPVALILSRQGLPVLDRTGLAPAEGLVRGAYLLLDAPGGKPDISLVATGSEVHTALDAARDLHERGIAASVVSMPSWDLFESQPEDYRKTIIPPNGKAVLVIEAGSTFGWDRHAKERSCIIGIDHFGASAPHKVLFEKFGLTAGRVVEKALELLSS